MLNEKSPMILHFRCIKISQEDKTIRSFGGETSNDKTAHLTFECLEANQARDGVFGFDLTFHGYISLILPIEEFKKGGYELGKVYSLSPT